MHWYVVNTKPRQEQMAEKSLQYLDLKTFLPLIQKNLGIRKKPQSLVYPLFPGYFFVSFDIDRHYRAVRYAHGVRDVITYGTVPTAIDDSTIFFIRSRLKEGVLPQTPSTFKTGETVRITSGSFEGFEAVFEGEMNSKDRVVLLLNSLEYKARIVINREDISSVHS